MKKDNVHSDDKDTGGTPVPGWSGFHYALGLSCAWIRISSDTVRIQTAPADLPPAGQIDVQQIGLPESDEPLAELYRMLTAEEQERADRFRVVEPRRRFIAGRGMMRSTLGQYLRCSPDEVVLDLPESGKPAVRRRPGDPDLQFNLSHSGDRIVLAFAVGTPIGIDVERLAERRMQREIAEKHYHPNELALLDAAADEEKAAVFCRCWTLKEAVIKAIGEGLRYPIRTLDFSQVLQGSPTDVAADGRTWRCVELDVGPGYRCAVAWALR